MDTQRGLWLFLVPSGLVLTLVLLYPLGYAIYLSFFNYYLGAGERTFVGLGNYTALLGDERFWSSLWKTLIIVGSAVSLEFVVGLAVAFGLCKLTFGVRTFNLLLFLPHIITPVVAALFLRWVFMGRWGLIDGLLISFNIFPPDWLGSPGWARLTVVLADAWQFTPFMILVLYAGLNTVDQNQIESAKMDGAGNWTILTRIMLPALRPLIVFVLAIRTMDAFRFFDSIYVLTAGGPGTATETITIYTYALAFRLLEVGKGSALGVLTLLIVAALVALLILLIYRRERGAF
ncbi:MAG: sugar ABC transporter permease [Alphaproteobacteria bacterium]|nr:sugar ABC transporter permease [Alphaproteobacteria bacterium]